MHRFALAYWASYSAQIRSSRETQGRGIIGPKDVSCAPYSVVSSGAYVTLELDYTEGILKTT